MTESAPDLDHFTHDDAWEVGSNLVARCRTEQLPVTISIWLGQQRVFHAALPGTSADNDAWVEKKANVVRRFGRSSLEVFEHYDVGPIPNSSRRSDCPAPSTLPARVPYRSESAAAWSASLPSPAWRRAATTSWRCPLSATFTTEHLTRAASCPCPGRGGARQTGPPRMMSPPHPDGTPTYQPRHHPTSKETPMTHPTDQPLLPTRSLSPGQTTQVWVVDIDNGVPELVYSSDELLLEAPNWAPDGTGLLLNGDGLLWRLDLEPAVALTPVPIEDLPPINNDHVVDAPRGLIYLSANDGHLYVAPIAGGTATRVSHDSTRYHFLHGVSPDGSHAGVRRPAPRRVLRGGSACPHPRRRRRDDATPRPAAVTSTAPSTPPTVPGST